MPTPRRRQSLATGAFFFPALLASAALLLASAGCASFPTLGKKNPPAPAAKARLLAPPHVEIGRVLSYDSADATAVIEFVPHQRSLAPSAGTQLIARRPDTLEPTARLVAAPYQNNRAFGAYVSSGAPGIDDEVVIAPESAIAPEPTPPLSP